MDLSTCVGSGQQELQVTGQDDSLTMGHSLPKNVIQHNSYFKNWMSGSFCLSQSMLVFLFCLRYSFLPHSFPLSFPFMLDFFFSFRYLFLPSLACSLTLNLLFLYKLVSYLIFLAFFFLFVFWGHFPKLKNLIQWTLKNLDLKGSLVQFCVDAQINVSNPHFTLKVFSNFHWLSGHTNRF